MGIAISRHCRTKTPKGSEEPSMAGDGTEAGPRMTVKKSSSIMEAVEVASSEEEACVSRDEDEEDCARSI